MKEQMAKTIVDGMKHKRKLLPYENKTLDLIKNQFLKELSKEWFYVYRINVTAYEKEGVDTGEHKRWVHYYKQKLEGRL
jgi:pullulanase/glycogen debranching enzyme